MPDTITLKVSGSLVDEAGIQTLAEAIEQAPMDQLVIVHGGGPQIDEAIAKTDEPADWHAGLRVTTRSMAGIVQATLDGIGSKLAKGLTEHGVPAEHVDSLQHALVAKTKHVDGADLGRVGTPVSVHENALTEAPTVSVVTPVGTDGTGPLNVNADEAAAAIAAAIDSQALVFATSVPGVLDDAGHPIDAIDPAKARRLVESGVAKGGMQPKLEAGLAALAEGVETVHVGSLAPSLITDALADETHEGTRIHPPREAIA